MAAALSRRGATVAFGAVVIALTMAAPASAQGPAQDQGAAPTRSDGGKWRLTFRVGGSMPNAPSSGLSALPTVGLPDTFLPGLADHAVPSWFFGDGSKILNANLPSSGHPIAPLDAVLTSASIARSAGPAFGVTISRRLTPRYRLEFALDGARTGPAFTSSARNAIEASRASFVDAFGSLFSDPAIQNLIATSTATVTDGSRMEWMVSGAVDVILLATARSEWHVMTGLGLISDLGTGATAALDGQDSFKLVSRSFAEDDHVTISSLRQSRPVVLLGGGWTRSLTRRWGLAADLRVAMSGPAETTQVSTNPTVTHFSPPDVPTIVIGPGLPTLTFSNNGTSTLGTKLAPFTTFVATGVQVRAEVTAGLFLRF